jgi:hypothetical protein
MHGSTAKTVRKGQISALDRVQNKAAKFEHHSKG